MAEKPYKCEAQFAFRCFLKSHKETHACEDSQMRDVGFP